MITSRDLPKEAVTFWFDTNQPRHNQGKKEALERWKKFKLESGQELIKYKRNQKSKKDKNRQTWHSLHHISGERSNGKADNLFICETELQHENLELQLKQMQIELVNSGAIGFSFGDKKYFVAWKPLANFIKDWREKNGKYT